MQKLLPISEFQKLFFLEWVLDPDNNTYNLSLVYRIVGDLNKQALKQACEMFIKKHSIVHAKYNADGSQCYYSNYNIEDFYSEKLVDKNIDIKLQIKQILYKPFDLTNDILFQLHLLVNTVNPNEYCFILNAHHIIIDAIGSYALVKDITDNYNHILSSPDAYDPNIRSNDDVFIQAVGVEREYLNAQYLNESRQYWLDFIDNIPMNTPLPYKQLAYTNLNHTKAGETKYFELNKMQRNILREYAKQNKSTLFIVLAALYGLLLSKYSNQTKLLFGYPVNVRPKGYKNVIGCFVNNLPLKIELDKYLTLEELIASLIIQRTEARNYQFYSLTNIIADQRKYNNVDIDNGFNIGFKQSNLNLLPLNLDGNLEAIPFEIPCSSSIINALTLGYDDSSVDKIQFRLEYQTALFDEEFIIEFIDAFTKLIETIIFQKTLNLKHYCALSNTTYQKIIYKWNNTDTDYPADKTIHQLFEEQALKTPDNIAVIYKDTKLTYMELNKKANQLSHYLKEKYKIQGDDLVSLCLDQSLDIITVILAVLKSGAGYVPIDPNYPDERIIHILEDTKAKVILANRIHSDKLAEIIRVNRSTIKIELIDSYDLQTKLINYSNDNPLQNITSNNLAYVIYTSGTTGKPKGVMIEHKSFVAFLLNLRYKMLRTQNLDIMSSTNYVFDIFGLEYGLPLINGYSVELVNLVSNNYNSHKLSIDKYGLIQLTPSKVDLLIEHFDTSVKLSNHHSITFLIAGEALTTNTIGKIAILREKYKDMLNITLFNAYGPTETTIWSLSKEIDLMTKSVSIGKPLNNETAYVLDNNLNPLPIGTIGELYIGGNGLARGYLNLPELTTEKFIANPFQSEYDKNNAKNARLYKTGDLVKYLPDGNIEYIGRNDSQVKIRGFRIELGEIENILNSYLGVKKTVLIIRDYKDSHGNITGNPYLIAYYVSDLKLDEEAMLMYLSNKLPEYMIPAIFMHIETLPLTINGKLDHKALPDPELTDIDNYVAPRNELEEKIAEIYADILGLPVNKIGIFDDFFRMGGNSILAIQVALRIGLAIDHKVVPNIIFKKRKICDLSAYLELQHLKPNRLITPLNRITENKPNLFLLPASFGGSEIYLYLAKKLEEHYNVYGLEPYNWIYKQQNVIKDIKVLASHYIDAILTLQNSGQYFLGGHCSGGLISFEMALQLSQKYNKDVQKVILIDSAIPNQEQKYYNTRLGNYFKRYELNKRRIEDEKSKEAAELEELFRLEPDFMDYTGELYHGDIILYRAVEFPQFILKASMEEKLCLDKLKELHATNNMLGWDSYVKNVKLYNLDASHFTIMQDKNIDVITNDIIVSTNLCNG